MRRRVRAALVAVAAVGMVGACAAGRPQTPDPGAGPSAPAQPLRVEGRYLATADGAPFFWLGDTAWALPSALTREETARYLDTRKAQGFDVVQVVALFPHAGGNGPNRYGDRPFRSGLGDLAVTPGADPGDRAAYDWWDNLDAVVDAAAARGIRVALLPVWADKQVGSLLTTGNARGYGEFVGRRYADRVVWVLGGDASAAGVEDVWATLAEGIRSGAGRDVLITYHPIGDASSVDWFAGRDWIDFHMIQGGHCLRFDERRDVVDRTERAGLPFLDGEPIYEEHPYCWDRPPEGFSTDRDVRRDAYWSVFGGAFGHTYGDHVVWQFQTPGRPAALGARPGGDWRTSLQAPGATQMRHLRALMESRPFTTGQPAQQVLRDPGRGGNRIQASRASDGSYLMAYVPDGRAFDVDLGALSGPARAWWYDPRRGTAVPAELSGTGWARASPPDGQDWVLVADDATRRFPTPGT